MGESTGCSVTQCLKMSYSRGDVAQFGRFQASSLSRFILDIQIIYTFGKKDGAVEEKRGERGEAEVEKERRRRERTRRGSGVWWYLCKGALS